MPLERSDLQTPWIRAHLIEWLAELSDKDQQEAHWLSRNPGRSRLDEALDFFDDSGVLDMPQGRLGFVLVDAGEVAAMRTLNSALERVLSGRSSNDTDLLRNPAWDDVVAAAQAALGRILTAGSHPGRL